MSGVGTLGIVLDIKDVVGGDGVLLVRESFLVRGGRCFCNLLVELIDVLTGVCLDCFGNVEEGIINLFWGN